METIRTSVSADTELFIVGGAVRDALLGHPIHDIDFATPGDGLRIARTLADTLQAAFYPLDTDRRTGRVQWVRDNEMLTIDVASFRGKSLEEDLRARDFTINAMAAPLHNHSSILDPLDGQTHLLDQKILYQCNEHSILSDPIRALRAVRMSLQFRLRMAPETRDAAKNVTGLLASESGDLLQPERCRDELFKLLSSPLAGSSIRLLHALGLLGVIVPYQLSESQYPRIQALVDRTSQLVRIIGPRDDNLASDLTMGVAVMILDRHRQQLWEHLEEQIIQDRTRATLLLLAALTPIETDFKLWVNRLRLSNREQKTLSEIAAALSFTFTSEPINDREIFQYFRLAGRSGVEGLLLRLALYLVEEDIALNPVDWGQLLDEVAGPILEAFFQRYEEVISPAPLVSGDDLQHELGIRPGPALGNILFQLVEEQASGTIATRDEALLIAKHLLDETDYGPTSTTRGS